MRCFPGHKEINFGIPQIKRSTRNTQMSGTLQTDYPEISLEKVTSHPGLPSEKARFVEDWPELTLGEILSLMLLLLPLRYKVRQKLFLALMVCIVECGST